MFVLNKEVNNSLKFLNSMESEDLKELKHHRQHELCTTRAAYRQGRKLTAVKVYNAIAVALKPFLNRS